MADHIVEMVRKADPQSIQKYVKNHLPNDPAYLQRIYNQLKDYSTKIIPTTKNKTQRTKSMATLQRNNSIKLKMKQDRQDYIRRSSSIIRVLKDRGYKAVEVKEQQSDRAQKMLHDKRDRIVKPLQINAKLMRSQQAPIDRLINRYSINCKYYRNNLDDVKLDMDKLMDRQMKEFIDRRQICLQSLHQNQNHNIIKNPLFSYVTSKISEPMTARVPYEQVPSTMRLMMSTKKETTSARSIMDTCESQIKQQKYKEIHPQLNLYRDLQQKIDDEQNNDIKLTNLINIQKIRQTMARQQYDRYTHSYMKMMTNKIHDGSKCKLNGYAKELLRDQKKMRNVIDFSKK